MDLVERLRALHLKINAEGGGHSDSYTEGYCDAIDRALDHLEGAGFKEGTSTAADEIEALRARVAELEETGERVVRWLDALADKADHDAVRYERFSSLSEACRADAKNYRATAADIRSTLEPPR